MQQQAPAQPAQPSLYAPATHKPRITILYTVNAVLDIAGALRVAANTANRLHYYHCHHHHRDPVHRVLHYLHLFPIYIAAYLSPIVSPLYRLRSMRRTLADSLTSAIIQKIS